MLSFARFTSSLNKVIFSSCIISLIGIILYQSILIFGLKSTLQAWKETERGNREVHTAGEFTYINPLLSCEFGYLIQGNNIVSNKKSIINKIEQYKSDGKAKNISVYYRQLNNGPTLGINEHEEFAPASLLKVPVMMTYYKYAEEHPEILEKKVKLNVKESREETTPPGNALDPSTFYTNEFLIERMITYSDNEALETLTAQLDQKVFDRTLTDIGLKAPDDPTTYTISVKSYASLFRVLYNASYLSPEMSEKAVKLLTLSDFQDGLRSTIPKEIQIGHKFGLRKTQSGEVKLHDCGIVYVPDDPYLLCIMTDGQSYTDLSFVISQISHVIYDLHQN